MYQQLPFLTPEDIEQNFLKFRSLCEAEKLGERSENVLKLIDDLSEQIATCPASGKKKYHRAEPGGLVDHSLRVYTNARKLASTFLKSASIDSIIITTLFHDLGKIGDGETEYFVQQNDQWRRDKLGELYTHNENITYMQVPDRSLYLLQKYHVVLSVDETLAIKLHDGFIIEGNREHCMKEPPLATIVLMADYIATKQEKGEMN